MKSTNFESEIDHIRWIQLVWSVVDEMWVGIDGRGRGRRRSRTGSGCARGVRRTCIGACVTFRSATLDYFALDGLHDLDPWTNERAGIGTGFKPRVALSSDRCPHLCTVWKCVLELRKSRDGPSHSQWTLRKLSSLQSRNEMRQIWFSKEVDPNLNPT